MRDQGDEMADGQAIANGHPDMDYAEHERTYRLFTKLTKYGLIFCIAVLAFMAVTLL
jgi:hypothetical protein